MKQRLAIIGLGATALLSWGQEPEPRLETEFVASDVYRSGSVIAGLWKDVHFDGEYIGTETANAGLTVLSWQFRWRSLFISPGFGAGFGSGVDVAPIVTLRWKLETPRFFSQGYAAQSLRGHIDEGITGSTRACSTITTSAFGSAALNSAGCGSTSNIAKRTTGKAAFAAAGDWDTALN
jgi:hypothetical protein